MDTRHGGKAVIAEGLGQMPEQSEPEQEELFERDNLADAPLFGTLITSEGRVKRERGRPAGSQNKTTEQARRLFLSRNRDPLMAAGEIISMGPEALVRTLRAKFKVSPEFALDFWRKTLFDTLPYIHQKRPIAIEGGGISAGILNVIIGDVGGNPAGGEFGVSMRLVDGEQNQALSEPLEDKSQADKSHSDDK